MPSSRFSIVSLFSSTLAFSGLAFAQGNLGDLTGTVAGGYFGASVVGLGDVNQDGFADFVVGEPRAFTYFNGKATVYSGKDHSVLYTFTGQDRDLFGTSVAGPGDLNGDSVPDIAVGAIEYYSDFTLAKGYINLYSGLTGALIWKANGLGAKEYLGTSLAVVGDVNHDGKTDFVAGSKFHLVRVISGANGSILSSINFNVFSFGWNVAAAGDVDQDGTPDFLVGAPTTTGGIVHLYSGATNALIRQWLGNFSGNDQIGYGLAGGVDWNDDGIPDIALGAPGSSLAGANYGAVLIRSGADDSLIRAYPGPSANAQFGYRLGVLGDVDADGTTDLLIGAMNENNGTSFGAAHMASGDSALEIGVLRAPAGTPMNSYAFAVAGLGDIDGDDLPDFAVSSPTVSAYGTVHLSSAIPHGTAPFGTGTPGCTGPEHLLANSSPTIGNTAFEVHGDAAPSSGTGFLLLAPNPDLFGTLAAGVKLHVGLGGALLVLPVASDANGYFDLAMPLPADPGIVGASVALQTLWTWSPTVCVPSAMGLSSSRGLIVEIQPQ